MPDTKITALSAISTIAPATDPLAIVDVSDTSMAASGTTKKITVNQIVGAGGTGSFSTLAASGAATLSDTLAVTGAATFNGNVTLGNAVTDVITSTGGLIARNGELASSIRAAASDYGGIYSDGTGTGSATSRCTSQLVGQNLAQSDFSTWIRFKVSPVGSDTRVFGMSGSSSNNTTANSVYVFFTSAGVLSFVKRSASNTFQSVGVVANFVQNYGGVCDLVITRSISSAEYKVYANGDLVLTSSSFATEDIDSTYLHAFEGELGINGPVYRMAVFNRTLSASDVSSLVVNGIDPADQWGSQEAVYASNFTAGTDSFAAVRATATGNVDGVLSVDETLRVTADATTGATHYATRTISSIAIAKRYRLSIDYYIPAGNTYVDSMIVQQNSGSGLVGPALLSPAVTGSWQTGQSAEFVALARRFDFLMADGGSAAGGDWSSDSFYLKNVILTRLGAIVDLDFSAGVGYQAHDLSTNLLHGTLYGAVYWTNPKKSGVLYGTTNTNGNQQILGTTSIPSDALITFIGVNSNGGTPSITIGNASGGSQVVTTTSLTGATRQAITPALPISTTGNLWVGSNGANTLNWTINYTTSF